MIGTLDLQRVTTLVLVKTTFPVFSLKTPSFLFTLHSSTVVTYTFIKISSNRPFLSPLHPTNLPQRLIFPLCQQEKQTKPPHLSELVHTSTPSLRSHFPPWSDPPCLSLPPLLKFAGRSKEEGLVPLYPSGPTSRSIQTTTPTLLFLNCTELK